MKLRNQVIKDRFGNEITLFNPMLYFLYGIVWCITVQIAVWVLIVV